MRASFLFTLSIFSYYFIEIPFRTKTKPYHIKLFIASIIVLVSFSGLIALGEILPLNHAKYQTKAHPYRGGFKVSKHIDDPLSIQGDKKQPDILVVGSSHARMYNATLLLIAEQHNLTIAFLTFDGQLGRLHQSNEIAYEDHKKFDVKRMETIQRLKPKIIFFNEFYINQFSKSEDFIDKYIHTFSTFLKHSAHIITMAPHPLAGTSKNLPK